MPMTVKVDTGALSKLIQSRGLQPGGRVQQVLTNEIYKQAEPYTPMRSKTLIRTAQVGKDHITYVQPYSRYVYFGKVMARQTAEEGNKQKPELWRRRKAGSNVDSENVGRKETGNQ